MKKIIITALAFTLFCAMVLGVTLYGLIMWAEEVSMF